RASHQAPRTSHQAPRAPLETPRCPAPRAADLLLLNRLVSFAFRLGLLRLRRKLCVRVENDERSTLLFVHDLVLSVRPHRLGMGRGTDELLRKRLCVSSRYGPQLPDRVRHEGIPIVRPLGRAPLFSFRSPFASGPHDPKRLQAMRPRGSSLRTS